MRGLYRQVRNSVMRHAARLFLLAALPIGLAACAPSNEAATGAGPGAGGPERRCFQTGQITNFRADRQTVYVKVGQSAVYELSAAGACPDLDSAFRVAMVAVGGGSNLCVDDPVTLVTPGQSSPVEVCRARIDRQLTDEQIAALPDRLRP